MWRLLTSQGGEKPKYRSPALWHKTCESINQSINSIHHAHFFSFLDFFLFDFASSISFFSFSFFKFLSFSALSFFLPFLLLPFSLHVYYIYFLQPSSFFLSVKSGRFLPHFSIRHTILLLLLHHLLSLPPLFLSLFLSLSLSLSPSLTHYPFSSFSLFLTLCANFTLIINLAIVVTAVTARISSSFSHPPSATCLITPLPTTLTAPLSKRRLFDYRLSFLRLLFWYPPPTSSRALTLRPLFRFSPPSSFFCCSLTLKSRSVN